MLCWNSAARPCSAPSDRKSTRLNSSHQIISYAVFCLKKKTLDLELTDQPAPLGDWPATDIPVALSRALANRPEFETVRQQLASDDLSTVLAPNSPNPH